jgi:hypothetical protein
MIDEFEGDVEREVGGWLGEEAVAVGGDVVGAEVGGDGGDVGFGVEGNAVDDCGGRRLVERGDGMG